MLRSLFLLCILLTGCARLPPGDIARLSPPAAVQVCLIRGYLDWYSTGIDQLAMQLRAEDIDAEAFREEQWGDIAAALTVRPPVILIGFSYGADDAILIARRLNDAHKSVELLITIDPVTPAAIPANVKHAVNFYEPNGFWDIFPWLRGMPAIADPGASIENINIRNRPDLNEPDTRHATIAANAKLHAQLAQLILKATKR